jgi:hypothetical protein
MIDRVEGHLAVLPLPHHRTYGRLIGEMIEILGARMVVLAHDHPAKAG